jgi:hypothetical protein
MKDLFKVIAVISALVALKRLSESKRICLSAGPLKICNH